MSVLREATTLTQEHIELLYSMGTGWSKLDVHESVLAWQMHPQMMAWRRNSVMDLMWRITDDGIAVRAATRRQ